MRGYFAVGLDNCKDSNNLGSAMRAIGCYDGAFLAVSGHRVSAKNATDTMKTYKHRPVLRVDNLKDIIPYDCVPIAVDLVENATPLHEYEHPERAFYIFGAEDATLGKRVLDWCRDKIYIPTNRCMNLAATVNVVLYDRQAKILRNKK